MHGLILIDKPLKWTSLDVVAKIRGIIRAETGQKIKVGHSGTLDPMATGLLIIAVGSYTKKLPDLITKDKTYLVEMKLGQVSTTGDQEGQICKVSDIRPLSEDIVKTMQSFEGEIMQTPPIYSAIKVNGQRAYKLARKGQTPKLEPRKVTINGVNMINYEYPKMVFEADVSSGTYIRSLVEDIGNKLGSGAYMSNLRRTKIGKFLVKDAISLDGLNYEKIIKHLLTLDN